jgi:hypothetical protein
MAYEPYVTPEYYQTEYEAVLCQRMSLKRLSARPAAILIP